MTTAVTKSDTRGLATVNPNQQAVLATDVIIPRLLLMQGLSDAVAEGKARMGEMIRSTTFEKLGDDKTPVSFVPLKMTTEWSDSEKVGQKFEFRTSYARTTANENLPWNYWRDANGKESDKPFPGATEWKRTKVVSVFALLKEDLARYAAEMKKAIETGEMPDINSGLLPVQISFRSTSFQAGRKVVNFYVQYNDLLSFQPNLKSYSYSLPLSCSKQQNDLGTFYVLDVGKPERLPEEYLPFADKWYGIINTKTGSIRVDETSADEVSTRASEQSIA